MVGWYAACKHIFHNTYNASQIEYCTDSWYIYIHTLKNRFVSLRIEYNIQYIIGSNRISFHAITQFSLFSNQFFSLVFFSYFSQSIVEFYHNSIRLYCIRSFVCNAHTHFQVFFFFFIFETSWWDFSLKIEPLFHEKIESFKLHTSWDRISLHKYCIKSTMNFRKKGNFKLCGVLCDWNQFKIVHQMLWMKNKTHISIIAFL